MTSLLEALDDLHTGHADYIQASYHLRHPRLIREREAILREPFGVTTTPILQATPRYETSGNFADLPLDPEIRQTLTAFAQRGLGAYDPPYTHQAKALDAFFNQHKDLIVSTGTGSGKTEIFLYSILGSLIREGKRTEEQPKRGIRALILYPMNALVSDQLARLRRFLGAQEAADVIGQHFGRTVQFGMYTSRTPYHGVFDTEKNEQQVKPAIKYYADLAADPKKKALYEQLNRKGRVPAKDVAGFFAGRGKTRYQTQSGDRELFTRQEMHSPNAHGGTPDILITNYSMLEYMLLRPIEQPLFERTREWLSDPANELLVVIDEAHLYRGAQGAEVAMLVRRLLQHLEVGRERVRFILTSASLGDDATAKDDGPAFAARLVGGKPTDFEVILGEKQEKGGTLPLDRETEFCDSLQGFTNKLETAHLENLAKYYQWPALPEDEASLAKFLAERLDTAPEFAAFHDELLNEPKSVSTLGTRLFPKCDAEKAANAVLNLALLASTAHFDEVTPLLSVRLHAMFRGLPRQHACLNPKCEGRRIKDDVPLLGQLFLEPQDSCPACKKSRVFELMSHRTCGAAYLRVFIDPKETAFPRFLWADKVNDSLVETHLLVEEPRQDAIKSDPRPPRPCYLDILTGFVEDKQPATNGGRYIPCWWPHEGEKPEPSQPATPKKGKPPEEKRTWSFPRCFACGAQETRYKGRTKIMDLETKGEDPFANLVKTLFISQPKKDEATPDGRPLPNAGRKVLSFSDGRQKAARLARDLQRIVERDSFREIMVLAADRAGANTPVDQLFSHFAVITAKHHITMFDDGDGDEEGGDLEGSRSVMNAAQTVALDLLTVLDMTSAQDRDFLKRELDGLTPHQYYQALLRTLGDEHFSVKSALVGYVRPTAEALSAIQHHCKALPPERVEEAVFAILEKALERRALDPRIAHRNRRLSRKSANSPTGYRPDDGEGIPPEDLVPDYVQAAFPEIAASLKIFELSLRRGGGPQNGPHLFLSEEGRFWINPAAVTLVPALDKDWYICRACSQFSPYAFNGKCPEPECRADVEKVTNTDLYLRTRKDFLRKPCVELLAGEEPLTLRSEEHTAQLNAKDRTEVFGRAERYELLFQDVLVDDLAGEQPVDVLSCTTTMEVGIDIGSLTAVALRTVPPRPDNYQQRSGRAGRRGSALSTIITFADNSPYEAHIFLNPKEIIGASNAKPTIYVENDKIAARHINASIIQLFFRHTQAAKKSGITPGAQNVFESLGTASSFFVGNHELSLSALEKWLDAEAATAGGVHDQLVKMVPEELTTHGWDKQRVADTAADFIGELRSIASSVDWESEDNATRNLLTVLLENALMPTFSFPIDLCNFVVQDYERKRKKGEPKPSVNEHKIVNRYDMSQDVAQALSEYAPGREIVVDKRTYVSYGLHFAMPKDYVNRARLSGLGNDVWLNHCRSCGTIIAGKETENLQSGGAKCPVCKDPEIKSVRHYRPEGFAPAFDPRKGPVEGDREAEERIYATTAEFPVPFVEIPLPGTTIHKLPGGTAEVREMRNQKLIVANFGPKKEGFFVCTECGAVGLDGLLPNAPSRHNRPYPIALHHLKKGEKMTCAGGGVTTLFTFPFLTDLATINVVARSPLQYNFDDPWFDDAATSLSEALVLGATRALKIDRVELAGNWRSLSRFENDPADVYARFDFFLYDTTSGGAGFAARAAQEIETVLDTTRDILVGCDCGASCNKCLRTYENRLHHARLNRHDALVLLEYVRNGIVPDLAPLNLTNMVTRLARALELKASPQGVELERLDGPRVRISRGGKSIECIIRPALRAVAPSMTPKEGASKKPREITDYDVKLQLPRVTAEILHALK